MTAVGAHWKQQRALLSPAFHFAALERLHAVFEAAGRRLVDKLDTACAATPAGGAPLDPSTLGGASSLPHGSEFVRSNAAFTPLGAGRANLELSSTFRTVTLEVISEIAIGWKPDQASIFPTLFEAVLDELNQRIFAPYRTLFPLPALAYRTKLANLNSIVRTIIAGRRALRKADPERYPSYASAYLGGKPLPAASPSSASAPSASAGGADASSPDDGAGLGANGKPIFAGGGDMLDLMLDSGTVLTDRQLTDEVKTQLLAGHETSSMMLTWACYLLVGHPAVLDNAVAEVDAALGGGGGFEAYKNMDYLGAVLKEAMRLYSPVPLLNREAAVDVELCGVSVPAGTAILVSIWALHKSPALWGPDPDVFRPERFQGEEARKRHAFAYMPFSVGARSCIGQNLAMLEARVVLAALLRRYTISLPPQPAPTTDAYVIPVRPAGPLYITVKRRDL